MINELNNRLKKLEEMFFASPLVAENAVATDRKRRLRVEVQSEALFGLHMATCVSTIDPLL